MRIFISSVRAGLETERDALPGLITALGHTPVRFEDFSAQPVPSREACLAGVDSSDVYLLLLGPRYGHRFSDTGQSATQDEWVAATAAGLPRLVYRKQGVEFEPAQAEFARQIEDYGSGVFRDSFMTVQDLQTKVVAKIRELERADSPLVFAQLADSVTVEWRGEFSGGRRGTAATSGAILELHVVPVPTAGFSSRVMAELADSLAERVRQSGMIDHSVGLSAQMHDGAVVVTPTTPPAHGVETLFTGLRVNRDGQVSVWTSLPRDDLGSIVDQSHLSEQIARLLRLIGALRVIRSQFVAFAVGVDAAGFLSIGKVTDMPRSSATHISLSQGLMRVLPDEQVSLAALDVGSTEMGRSLSRALVGAIEDRRKHNPFS